MNVEDRNWLNESGRCAKDDAIPHFETSLIPL